MNIPNNKRKKDSQLKIEKVFVNLLRTKEIHEINVTDIVKLAKVNRSTFYANYIDIYDLAEKIGNNMINEIERIYADERDNQYNSDDYLKLFKHIKDNQLFYKTLFKLKIDQKIETTAYDTYLSKKIYNDEFIDYHIEFFKAGFNAIIKKWLSNDCKETPEEMMEIIKSEYKGKCLD
ncbi:MAG: TetR-like C-terminal domain-containing protein [Beduini sp.]|uniref:TetR-like C-terminal domain-containing protein n=1 Tax=Beduini sp. TaxID=1922300 RepID=UPI0039A23873